VRCLDLPLLLAEGFLPFKGRIEVGMGRHLVWLMHRIQFRCRGVARRQQIADDAVVVDTEASSLSDTAPYPVWA
jgi:hypothetical protein